MRGSTTMAASVISPALLFRLVILISLPSGAVKDVQVIQGIVQLVYKILDKYLDELVAGGVAIRMAVGVYIILIMVINCLRMVQQLQLVGV